MRVAETMRRSLTDPTSVAARLGCTIIVLLGLVRSLIICLRRQPDADMATVPLLAEAVQRHGLSVLSLWHYTQDNWLLSVIIPELPLQTLLYPGSWLPALTGWMFFAGCCALTALLARPAVGRVPATLLGATLLFASPADLTGFGFLAHPASHNVTAFWCMLALLAIMTSMRGGKSVLLLPAAAACLLVATISDPWAKASFLLPLSLAASAAALLMAGRPRWVACLTIGMTVLCWLAGSLAHGLLPALTAEHFDRGPLSSIPVHLYAGLIGLGRLFGIDGILPSLAEANTRALPSLLVVVGLSGVAILTVLRQPERLRTPDGFLTLVCLLSAGGTLAAFALSAMPADTALARLVLNQYFVIPLFLCLTLATKAGPGGSFILGSAGAVFIISGLVEHWQPVREHSVSAAGWQTRLTDFLQTHDLHYGYGGYWGSDANSSRVRTSGAVTIRPVSSPGAGLPIQPYQSQTFDSWYNFRDAGEDSPTHFLVAVPDPDLCSDGDRCYALAVRSFGLPEHVLQWEHHTILVWSHPIINMLPTRPVLDALPLTDGEPVSGDRLLPYLWTGWAVPNQDGSWMYGHAGVVMLPPSASRQCLRLRAASGPQGGPTQWLQLRQDGVSLALWQVPPGVVTEHCLPPHPTAQAIELAHGQQDDGQVASILFITLSSTKNR